jgi:hypothetical protein
VFTEGTLNLTSRSYFESPVESLVLADDCGPTSHARAYQPIPRQYNDSLSTSNVT